MSSSSRKLVRFVWVMEIVLLAAYGLWVHYFWFMPGVLGRHGPLGARIPVARLFLTETINRMAALVPADQSIDKEDMQALVQRVSEEVRPPRGLVIGAEDRSARTVGADVLEFRTPKPSDLNAPDPVSVETVVLALRREGQRSWVASAYFVQSYASVLSPEEFVGLNMRELRDISSYSEKWGLAYAPDR